MSIYDKASLVQIPSGYKSGTLYSVVPNDADGDFDFTRASTGTRVNKDGLIETVSANVPRLNYNFIDGVVQPNPHLLLELERTQLAEYTNAISSANGYSLTNGTLTTDSHTAPDGSNEASTFEATSANGQFQKVKIGSSGTEYTVSAYVKRKTGTGKVYLRAVENTNTEVTIYDYWTRVSLTVTSTSTSIRYGMALETSGDEVYVWGFQVEVGSYPTSLIPNTSSGEITRTQDDFENSFTGLTSTAATIFLDFETQGLDFNFARLFAVHDSITSDGIYLGIYSTNTIGFFGIDGGAGLPDVKDTISFNERNKLVLAFDGSGNYKYSLNGSLQTGTYVGTSRQYDEVGRGNVIGGSSNNVQIHQIIVFDEVLSDNELEEITSYKSFGQMAKALLYTIE